MIAMRDHETTGDPYTKSMKILTLYRSSSPSLMIKPIPYTISDI